MKQPIDFNALADELEGVTVGFAATPVTGMLPHSGNAATRYAPFLPLAVSDVGIKDFEAFTC